MKINKTLLLALFTSTVIGSVYYFDYMRGQKIEAAETAAVLTDNLDHISYIQILKGEQKIALQKKESGWDLLEPMQDLADNDSIDKFLQELSEEKQISTVKTSEKGFTDAELAEYGLDKPAAIFSFKNNAGKSQKISIGAVKNFEGNSYLYLDSENKVVLAGAGWNNFAQKEVIFYREKKLFRNNIAHIKKIKIKSLRDNFELVRDNDKWTSQSHKFELDQNKVREILKRVSETQVLEYVNEGEPPMRVINEKGLGAEALKIELQSDDNQWSVSMNVNMQDKALYALTERPTYLVKIEPPVWEFFGNLSLDSLRDRTSLLAFKADEVKKLYVKQGDKEINLVSVNDKWQPNEISPEKKLNEPGLKRTMGRIHDLKISEFIDDAKDRAKFEGKNMLILKSSTEKLVLQLNWGPAFKIKKSGQEKEYYYARTHNSDLVFALEKSIIDGLEFDQIFENSVKKEEKIEK